MAVYKSIEGYGLRVSSMAPIANLAGLFGIGLDPDRPQPTSSTFLGARIPVRLYITNPFTDAMFKCLKFDWNRHIYAGFSFGS